MNILHQLTIGELHIQNFYLKKLIKSFLFIIFIFLKKFLFFNNSILFLKKLIE